MVIIFKFAFSFVAGKGGKNRRRGKNENETEKRELVFKEDGQGKNFENNLSRSFAFRRRESLELRLFDPRIYHMLAIMKQ